MKKRRNLIISLLLVAAIALGVGYAATSGSLTINGTVTPTEQAFKVHFTAYTPDDAATTAGVNVVLPPVIDDSVVSYTVTNIRPDGVAAGTLTITNHNDFPMYITTANISITNPDATLLDINAEFVETDDVIELQPNGTTDLYVTVEMLRGSSNSESVEFTISITGVTAVDPR